MVPPPGLETLGPKTEAQMDAEERRKKEKDADGKYRAALNKDFREIYGYTKESARKSINVVNDR